MAVTAAEALLRAVISRHLGTDQLGLYYLAARLAGLPLSTVSQLVLTVGISIHARLQSDLPRSRRIPGVVTTMAAVLLPTYALLLVLAPGMTAYVLGAKWSGAAPIIRILALGNIAGIAAGAIRPMLEGRGYPQYASVLLVASQTLVIAFATVAGSWAGVVGVAWARTVVEFAP